MTDEHSSNPIDLGAFLRLVTDRTHCANLDETQQLVEATVRTLAEWLPNSEAARLASYLPHQLTGRLVLSERREEPGRLDAFLTVVESRRGPVCDRCELLSGVMGVLAALCESMPAVVMERVRAALPDEFVALFED